MRQISWVEVDSETFGTNRIAQTSRENPVESLCVVSVNRSYHGGNDCWHLPLLDNGMGLISIHQGRGDRHTYSMTLSGRVPIGP